MNKFFGWLSGRTTFFLLFFTIVGTLLHLFHRLDQVYIGFIVTIMGFVLTHSVKEDYHERATTALTNAAPPQGDKAEA